MAHEVETMMYVGETPWHTLGVRLSEADAYSWPLACKAAGLDWTVHQEDLFLHDGRSVTHKANIRNTDSAILGVVGPNTHVLQNSDVFAWFEPFLETQACRFEAAGSLRSGSRIWALAAIPDAAAEVAPGDAVKTYVLLSHAHDNTLAIRVGFTDVRVVCTNTLRASHRDKASQLIRVKHTAKMHDSLAEIREVMDVGRQRFAATIQQYRRLAAKKDIQRRDVERYVQLVLEVEPNPKTRAQQKIDTIVNLAYNGKGNNLDGHLSMWDAFNGLTEYTTWSAGRSPETRIDSLWFGANANLNDRALDVALQLVDA